VWSKQFENIEKGNPALSFIREMQSSAHITIAACALAHYKLAASGMRTVVESALYYSYFRTHKSELATLMRDSDWHITKQEILDYHQTHPPESSKLHRSLPLASRLSPWYSRISAVIHGQVPGVWNGEGGLANRTHRLELIDEVTKEFCEAVAIVDCIFFLTTGRELWATFSTHAKSTLVHGMQGDLRATLGLDAA